MRVACLQLNSNDEPPANVERACLAIDRVCVEQQPDLVVLPEFFNTFYFCQYRDCRYLELAESADGPSLSAVRQRAARHRVNIVAPIYEIDGPGRYFDSAFLIARDGEIVGRYRKVHPAATSSVEKIYFRYGTRFPVWQLEGWRIGALICYDTFFPEAARALAVQGVELIICPFAGGNLPLWNELHQIRAFENLAYVVVCDKVGREGDWNFGGKSMVVDPLGQIIVRAGEEREETIVADLERDKVYAARNTFPMYRDRQPWAYTALCELD